MARHSDAMLTVQATLLSAPPLWCWEIVDATNGALVESSWQSRWEAYASRGEALRHAGPALQRLSRGTKLAAVLRPQVVADPAADVPPTDAGSLAPREGPPSPARPRVVGIRRTR